MNQFDSKREEGPSIGTIIQEITASLREIVQAEIRIATVELKHAWSDFSQNSFWLSVFVGILALSVLPLLAFLVIGLGRLMGDNYWLSSLIVGVVFASVGGTGSLIAFKNLRMVGLSLPNARQSLAREQRLVREKLEGLPLQTVQHVGALRSHLWQDIEGKTEPSSSSSRRVAS